MRSPQFWVVLSLLLAAATTMHMRGDRDRVPSSVPLSEMPKRIGPWTGADVPMDDEVLAVLGKGVFLSRIYTPNGELPRAEVPASASAAADSSTVADKGMVELFIGYFPTQRTGQSIHSPQNCLPGAGWVFDSSGTTEITDDSGKSMRVGEYLISNGNSRNEVLYWYRSHGRSIASDYAAKFYMLEDSIRYSRTDAALVRVITPVAANEDRALAHQRAVNFVKRLSPLLPAYIPD